MNPIYLNEVEAAPKAGPPGASIAAMKQAGIPILRILYLFAFRPGMTGHFLRFTKESRPAARGGGGATKGSKGRGA